MRRKHPSYISYIYRTQGKDYTSKEAVRACENQNGHRSPPDRRKRLAMMLPELSIRPNPERRCRLILLQIALLHVRGLLKRDVKIQGGSRLLLHDPCPPRRHAATPPRRSPRASVRRS